MPDTPRCAWCLHQVRMDLRPAFTSWGALVLECITADWCDMRSTERALHLGAHFDDDGAL